MFDCFVKSEIMIQYCQIIISDYIIMIKCYLIYIKILIYNSNIFQTGVKIIIIILLYCLVILLDNLLFDILSFVL